MSGYSRGNPAMGDVVRSVVLLGVGVLVLFLVGSLLFGRTPDQPTREVDWRTAASGVEPRAGYAPMVPSDLPERWRATSAELVDQRWQLGVVTDDDHYIGLSQHPGSADDLVRSRANGSRPDGEVTLGDRTWQRRSGPGRDTTYVWSDAAQAVVVRGDAEPAVIEQYLATLRPYSG